MHFQISRTCKASNLDLSENLFAHSILVREALGASAQKLFLKFGWLVVAIRLSGVKTFRPQATTFASGFGG
eukprot:228171-Hanusia_phi.AAC.3